MIKLAVVEKRPIFPARRFGGPMRVVYNLCQEWGKSKDVKLIALSNTLPTLLNAAALQFRFLPFHFMTHTLVMYRARSCQFDVINVHGISRNIVEITKLCKKRRIPIVYTAHGAAYEERRLGYTYSDEFIDQEKQMISLANKIVAVSPELKKLLIAHYELPDEKVSFIYNGVDPNFGRRKYRHINVREKYGIPKNRKILLNIGGTRKVKDIPFLIESLGLLKRGDWHLVLIGRKGEDHDNILRKCKSDLGNQFTFTGLVSENELLSFYHQALLCIATSKYEPFGLTPLEAMSCGTDAVVRSTIGGARQYFCNIPELLRKNIFGTRQELANMITNYLEGGQMIERKLLQRILQYNSWEKRANEYLQVLSQLMGK